MIDSVFIVKQLVMRAHLGEASIFHHQQAIRSTQRGKAVGNGDGRAASGQMAHRLLNLLLRLYVDRGGRLV